MDANAAASGSIPLQVFLDLAIRQTATQERLCREHGANDL
jgi:hypothetical protein